MSATQLTFAPHWSLTADITALIRALNESFDALVRLSQLVDDLERQAS